MKCALISVRKNVQLLRVIKKAFPLVYEVEGKSIFEKLEKVFRWYNTLIFVGSTAILLRNVAPLLTSKRRDPAIAVLDERLNHCIPLLSNHLGGAVWLCELLKTKLGVEPVYTTATDVNGLCGVDPLAFKLGYAIHPDDVHKIKEVNSLLLERGFLKYFGNLGTWVIPGHYIKTDGPYDADVLFDMSKRIKHLNAIRLYSKKFALGVGFHCGLSGADLYEAFRRILPAELSFRIGAVATIRDRWDLPSIHEFSRRIGAYFTFGFPKKALEKSFYGYLGGKVSDAALKYRGIPSVARASGFMASLGGKEVVTVKDKGIGVKFSVFEARDLHWCRKLLRFERVPEILHKQR
ncbi:MAG: cobalamin biosynthesis protein [Synergistetes bacterium]|nr:cobalamin biosynthesis protein [Synergistota bacterium]